jgi:mono/diheme cytochrome c family protein
MTRLAIWSRDLMLVLVLGVTSAPGVAAAQAQGTAAQVERGKAVYKEQNCATCHAIGGVGNKRSPLDGVGTKLNEDTIRKWIVSPRDINPTVRKKGFSSLSKADLDALVAYLRTLRSPAGR